MKYSLGISNFLEEISSLFPFYCFPLILYIVHLKRLSYLSLLFSGTLHSDEYIFPFLCCLSLLFSQLFLRPSKTTILLFCTCFSQEWFWAPPPVQCYIPLSIARQTLYKIWSLESICYFHHVSLGNWWNRSLDIFRDRFHDPNPWISS